MEGWWKWTGTGSRCVDRQTILTITETGSELRIYRKQMTRRVDQLNRLRSSLNKALGQVDLLRSGRLKKRTVKDALRAAKVIPWKA